MQIYESLASTRGAYIHEVPACERCLSRGACTRGTCTKDACTRGACTRGTFMRGTCLHERCLHERCLHKTAPAWEVPTREACMNACACMHKRHLYMHLKIKVSLMYRGSIALALQQSLQIGYEWTLYALRNTFLMQFWLTHSAFLPHLLPPMPCFGSLNIWALLAVW